MRLIRDLKSAVPATHVLCQAVVVAAQAEDEVAGLPDVDPITDVLE